MCRVFAFLSVNPVLLDDVLRKPTNAITKQLEAKWETTGAYYNVDGFGISWYTEERSEIEHLAKENAAKRNATPSSNNSVEAGAPSNAQVPPFVSHPHPAVYKTTNAKPLNDPVFRSLCANVASKCILAHMRAAWDPPVSPTNCHPFVFGRHCFMFNGGISQFPLVRKAILGFIAPEFVAMIYGSTDTEHLGALYMTYLCGEEYELGADKHYPAEKMWKALKSAIRKVEEIQSKHDKIKDSEIDNYFNICAADGESLIGLCYRTKNPAVPLLVSLRAADVLNRKPQYPRPKNIKPSRVEKDVRESGHAENLLIYDGDGKLVIDPHFQRQIKEQKSKTAKHGPHVIIASEPTDCWRRLVNRQAILVDTVLKGQNKDVRALDLAGKELKATSTVRSSSL